MYRELASLDAFGVPGGPYTGAPRTFRYRTLPESVRARLARCIGREELPTPLLTVSTGRRWRALYSLAAALIAALPWAWAATLAPARIVPVAWVAICVVPYVAAGWLAHRALRRDQLQGGVYLFPLDIVEAWGDTLRVTPLGSLRNAGIRREQSRIWLELRFDHGASYRFACPDDAAAERAYARICEAHAAVERITFGRDLEETVDMDPFFAIRGDDAWMAAAAPFGGETRMRNVRGMVAGALAGTLVFGAVAARGDHALYRDAAATHAPEGYQRYLDAGGRLHKTEAELTLRALRDAQVQHREFLERERAAAAAAPKAHRPDAELTAEQKVERLDQQEAALTRYEKLVDAAPPSWRRHVDFARILRGVFETARERGDDAIYFDFVRPPIAGSSLDLAPLVQASLQARETRLLSAFAHVLSQTVPTSVLTVQRLAEPPSERLILVVEIQEHVTIRTASDIDLEFDVFPRERGRDQPSQFRLSMPAPKGKAALRPRSLFSAPPANDSPDAQIARLTARAFDRLYDETYGLFFPGDPVVPIATEELK